MAAVGHDGLVRPVRFAAGVRRADLRATMRDLGPSPGMAVGPGLCSVPGTLIPPMFAGDFAAAWPDPRSGEVVPGEPASCPPAS